MEEQCDIFVWRKGEAEEHNLCQEFYICTRNTGAMIQEEEWAIHRTLGVISIAMSGTASEHNGIFKKLSWLLHWLRKN